MKEHIFLIGFMGVGKTSTSHALSRILKVEELDTDQMIVEQEQMEISEIFSQKGEEEFRRIETGVIEKLSSYPPSVVSCGGGVVLRAENVKIMKRLGKILLLTAAPETVLERVKHGTERPLLKGHMDVEYIAGLMREREERYQSAADLQIVTDGRTPEQVAERIADQIA